jgi:hypothetical protein
MYPDKTKQLLEWLEMSQPNRLFNLQDMKELLSIAITELSDKNDKSFETLPGNIVEAVTESIKTTGEYYRLDNQIEKFKSQFNG